MVKHILVLPDGTQVTSGAGEQNAIQSVKLTQCVNSGSELTLGSCCASLLEVQLITPRGGLRLHAGDEVTLLRVCEDTREQLGVFVLEKPTRPTANTLQLTGYDRVVKLDRDISAYITGLLGWPYTLQELAQLCCQACGLTLSGTVPGGSYRAARFDAAGLTGRRLMQYIGQAAGCFVRADAQGRIEFAAYTPSGIAIGPTGAHFYYRNSLRYEDFQVAPVDLVQLRLRGESGTFLWPEGGDNVYTLSGNPLLADTGEETAARLEAVRASIPHGYRPGSVKVPASMGIRAGDVLTVTEPGGLSFPMLAMTVTTKGQQTTVECTGSARRDSATALNNKTAAQLREENRQYADDAVLGLTQQALFHKLTNGGEVQGFYIQDGKLYINAEFVQILNLVAQTLKSVSGDNALQADGGQIKLYCGDALNVWLYNMFSGYPVLQLHDTWTGAQDVCQLFPGSFKLGGTMDAPAFRVVTRDGKSDVQLDTLIPSGAGNCKWEYIESIGKTLLVQQDG